MSKIGIAVVTHNSEATIGACLNSVANMGADIIVADNASSDGTCREVRRRPGVRLIANPWNRGFAAGANQAIGALGCDLVLVLNPDAELEGGLDGLIDACSRPEVAAAGGKLVGADGRNQAGFMVRRLPTPATLALEALGINRLWSSNPVNRRFRCFDLDPNAPAEVEQPAGAFLMLRRDAWRKLGGFDESFHPLWFEDVDYCKRALAAGYRIRYAPSATAKHQGGHSARQLGASARELYWYGNLLRYAAKHFRRLGFRVVCTAVMLGSFLRSILGLFRSGSRNSGWVYGRVIRLAMLYPSGQREGPRLRSAFAEQ
jgi:GT2 family glycosyltransferase